MKTKVFGHRGASEYAPENTMEAFKLAYDMGADGLELDIHLTKDGQPVVIHDSTIDRTSDGKGQVEDLTYEELLKYDFSYKFAGQYRNVKIPLLKDVLEFVKETDLILNIEIKFGANRNNSIEEKTVSLIKKYDLTQKIIISSFDHISLFKTKEICPNLVTAPLYSCVLYRPWEYAKTFGATGLHPYAGAVDKELIIGCQKSDMFVNVWTVNNPVEIQKFIDLSLDGIITNVPDLARQLVDKA